MQPKTTFRVNIHKSNEKRGKEGYTPTKNGTKSKELLEKDDPSLKKKQYQKIFLAKIGGNVFNNSKNLINFQSGKLNGKLKLQKKLSQKDDQFGSIKVLGYESPQRQTQLLKLKQNKLQISSAALIKYVQSPHITKVNVDVLQKIFTVIETESARFGLIGFEIFKQIKKSYERSSITSAQRRDLIRHLLEYLQQCNARLLNRTKMQIDPDFDGKLGQKVLRTQNEAHFNCKDTLRIVAFLAKSDEKYGCYLNLDFNLGLEEALAVAGKVREIYKYDERSFFFLSHYLQASCLKLQKQGRNIKEINEALETVFSAIQKEYPAARPLPSDKELDYIKDIKLAKKHLILQFLDFRQIEPEKRKMEIDNFIFQRAEQAIASKEKFKNLIEDTCREKGSHFKLGVKVKDRQHHRALDRVIEKMIKKNFTKYSAEQHFKKYPKGDAATLQSYLTEQRWLYESQMNQIYAKIDEPIVFKVTDMLRAKCLFQTVAQINQCADKLKEKIQAEGFILIQLDNRLRKNTSDVVFKILVDKTVAELQLSIDFNAAHNEFDHKVYELRRSAFHSAFSMIKSINQQMGGDFLQEIWEVFRQINRNNTHEQQRAVYDLGEVTFSSLQKDFEQLLKMVGFKPTKERIKVDDISLVSQLQEILEESKLLQLSEGWKKKINSHNGDYYLASHRYDQAMQQYQAYLNYLERLKMVEEVRRQIDHVNQKMGIALENKGKLSEAMAYYEKNLSMSPIAKKKKEKRQDKFALQNEKKDTVKIIKIEENDNKKIQIQNNMQIGQDLSTANNLCNMGNVYQSQGKYKQALDYYTRSLNIYEKVLGRRVIQSAATLNKIGNIYKSQGNYNQALNHYRRSRDIYEQIKGKQSIDAAAAINNIGNVYLSQGNYSEAIEYYTRCLEIEQKLLGKGAIKTAATINNLGNVYLNLQNYREAYEHYTRCLQIQEKVLGRGSLKTADTLNNLGNLYFNQGKNSQSLEYFTKSLQIQETMSGKGSIDSAITLHNIGNVYKNQEKYTDALTYYTRSLEIQEAAKGRGAIDTAATLNNMGSVFKNQKKYSLALDHYSRSLQIYENVLGKGSFDTASILNNMGNSFVCEENYSKALEYYLRCLDIYEKAKGKGANITVNILNNIGISYQNLADYGKALEYYNRCLNIQQKSKGKGSIQTIATLTNMASTCYASGNYQNALEYYTCCLEMYEKFRGNEAVELVAILNNIGLVLQKQKNYIQALNNYIRSLEIQQKLHGRKAGQITSNLKNIGSIYIQIGNDEEAIKYYLRSLQIQERIKGNQSIQTSATHKNLGNAYYNIRNYAKSLEHYTLSLNIQEKLTGSNNMNKASILKIMGSACLNLANYNQAIKFYSRSLEIQEQILGPENIQIVSTLTSIGNAYLNNGNQEEAIKFYSRSLEIQERTKGSETLQVSNTHKDIGNAYFNQRNYVQSLEHYAISLQIEEKIMGKGNINTANTLKTMGSAYLNLGNQRNAIKHFTLCLQIEEKQYGKGCLESASTFKGIGNAFFNKEDYPSALDNYKSSLEIYQKMDGQHIFQRANLLKNMGNSYKYQKKYNEALDYYSKSLQLHQIIYGNGAIECAPIAENIGLMLNYRHKYGEAVKRYKQAREIYVNSQGDNSKQVQNLDQIISSTSRRIKS